MHKRKEGDDLSIIEAARVREELTRTSGGESGTGDGAYRLRDTIIEGDLDLSHCRVTRPVEIHGCHFKGEVDLRYGEFTQAVDFSRCVFHKRLNSGDRHHTRAIYRKDLIFTGATFMDLVSFNRAYVEGHASFADAHFTSIVEDGRAHEIEGAADFSGMQIERNLICGWAIFEREVSFNALRCRTGEFHGTRFESDKQIDFRSAYFTGNIEFEDLRVEKKYVEDRFLDPRELQNLPGPIVRGKLNLRGFKCLRRAIFAGVEFAGEVDCENAVFGWYLDCRGAVFKDKSSFVRAKCDGAGLFQDASFEYRGNGSAVDFRYACFESLEFSRAVFLGQVSLGQTRIEEKLRLDEARFDAEVLLYGARIGTIELLEEGYRFKDVLQVSDERPGDRRNAENTPASHEPRDLHGPSRPAHDIRMGEFERMCQELGARWGKKSGNEEDVRIWLHETMRIDPDIRAMVTTYFFPFQAKKPTPPSQSTPNAVWTRLWAPWGTIDPEPAPRGVELDGCTFRRIHAGPVPALAAELIRAFAASQKVDRFSRDVYLQLEQFYSQTGNEERARDMHLWGHLATRRNASTEGGAIKWSAAQMTKDSALMLTGWGLQTWRIWLICLLTVFGATLYFAVGDGVLRVSTEPNTTISGVIPGVGEVRFNQRPGTSGETAASGTPAPGDLADCVGEGVACWLRRGGYSLTTFIPAVQLGLDQGWEPAKGFPEVARLALVLSGWLLVPLGIGSITGIIRSDRN